jgi:ubiquinone/menaquinone biosynthesis C-methylase UbiE
MSTPPNPRREQPSTYFVQDRSNEDEFTRLQIADNLTTRDMGGVLSEQSDPTIFQRVLDVGCGTGGWLIETAKTYPSMSKLLGVDISSKLVEYARTQAEAQQVSDRVEFHVMDALRMLEFPESYFDLVNHRLATSYLRTWDWPKLLQEYQRVAKPGGVIRVTEADFSIENTSPALSRILELALRAFHQAGHLFTLDKHEVTSQLVRLLHKSGLRNVQTRAYTLHYRAGTPEGQRFYENMRLLLRTNVPFLRKWVRLPDDQETLWQQALVEMQQPDFVATMYLLTAWGTNPPDK